MGEKISQFIRPILVDRYHEAKKPIHDGYMGFDSYDCPSCNKTVCDTDNSGNIIKKYDFCTSCGQRIKWD